MIDRIFNPWVLLSIGVSVLGATMILGLNSFSLRKLDPQIDSSVGKQSVAVALKAAIRVLLFLISLLILISGVMGFFIAFKTA